MEAFIIKRSGDSKVITKPFCFTTHSTYSSSPALIDEKQSTSLFQSSGVTKDCKIGNEVISNN